MAALATKFELRRVSKIAIRANFLIWRHTPRKTSDFQDFQTGISGISFLGAPSIETPLCNSKRLRLGWEVDSIPNGLIKVY